MNRIPYGILPPAYSTFRYATQHQRFESVKGYPWVSPVYRVNPTYIYIYMYLYMYIDIDMIPRVNPKYIYI